MSPGAGNLPTCLASGRWLSQTTSTEWVVSWTTCTHKTLFALQVMKWGRGMRIRLHVYRIVPSKRPWALAAQAPKFGGGRLDRKGLKWFNYSRATAHHGCKVGNHGAESTCIIGSSVLRRGQPVSGEGCIVLQSGLTHSVVAKFLQRSVIAWSSTKRILCCKGGTLWTRPWTGVCEPDVVAPKAHQSYVSSADVPSDSLRTNLAWWAVTWKTLKNHKTVESGGWALAWVWVLTRDNTVSHSHKHTCTYLFDT